MAAKRHERTSARRAALQVLYTSEITDESPAAIAESDRYLSDEGPLSDYALMLVRGVEAHRVTLDKYLVATSENWSLSRMSIVDRSILRLATFEVMYVDDVPTSVAINEAVELAKDFGGEDESPRFVNGILGRIAKMLEGQEEKGSGEAREAQKTQEPQEGLGIQEAKEPQAAPETQESSEPQESQETPKPQEVLELQNPESTPSAPQKCASSEEKSASTEGALSHGA